MKQTVSIIIPAKNEELGLATLLPALRKCYRDYEIIVVNDGSTDKTEQVCLENKVTIISHPYTMGNGAAIKTGARYATSDLIVFMDADGQHDIEDIPRLLGKIHDGCEMVVGARQADTHASFSRRLANAMFNKFASVMTGHDIKDLTSGFRAVRARHFRRFLYLLPNGFSYPTTSTMAFFRSGLPVSYISIRAKQREGSSKISVVKDGTKFLLIILKIGSLFSPLRLFLPISLAFFSIGVAHYGYTYLTTGRFTNMSALLFISSLFTFLMGMISEQISALHYKDSSMETRRTKRE